MEEPTVIVVAGGALPSPRAPTAVAAAAAGTAVIAADGGIDRAHALGLQVHLAVGDFDSVSRAGLARAEAQGARIERHPTTKDATDLELALDAALELEPRRILVLGSAGGRLDHLLASLLLLGSDRYAGVELDAHLDGAWAHVIRGERTLAGATGELVSLLALQRSAEGVSTSGLLYPLADETLHPGSSRGVSNVFTGSEARIAVRAGALLAVRPGEGS